jgi:uncharacterized protein (TIGR03437 family)
MEPPGVVRLRPSFIFLLLLLALCLVSLRSGLSQSNAIRRVTNTTEDGININPSLSGDGRRIAFESTKDIAGAGGAISFRAIRADISGDPVAFMQLGATRSPAPGISQDGSRIAFASKDNPLGTNSDFNSEIFYFDGSTLRQITNTSPGDVSLRARNGSFLPSLSDDGRFIAFSSNRDLANSNADANLEIFIYDITTQSFSQLTSTVGINGSTDAKISGNGLMVAYIRDNNVSPGTGPRDLLLQPRTGGPSRTIATGVGNLLLTYGRAISDDGTRVVYAGDSVPGTSQVFFFDGRGNTTRQITTLAAPLSSAPDVPLHPTISGDGSRIAFATRRVVIPGFNNLSTDRTIELYTFDVPTGQFAHVTDVPADRDADGYNGSNLVTEVVSSLNDDGTIVAFNYPRLLSGPVSDSDVENNSEIYVTATTPRPQFGTLVVLNGASFGNEPATTEAVAPDSIAVAQGGALANTTIQAERQPDGTFPRNVGGTTVTVNGRPAQIFFVSPSQVNFLVPPETEIGTAEVVVTNPDGFQSRGTVAVLRAAPGIFTYSGDGRGEGVILDASTLQPGPFDPTSGNLRLIIFSTGVRNASQVTVTIGGRQATLESVMASPDMPGLDEVHVLVPSDLRGAGQVDVIIRADGRDSNPVQVTFTGEARRDIVINEVLADPPDGAAGDANHDGVRSGTDDEFVELVNASGHDIDISGYQLFSRSNTATNDTLRHTFAAGTIFPAGTAIVVFGGGNFNPNDPIFGNALVVKASTGGLSLTNAGGVVTLKEPGGALVQFFSYGGSTGLNGDANQSLTRSPDAGDNSPGGNFILHTTAPNSGGRAFSPGTRVNGTPFAARTIGFIIVSPSNATINVGGQQQFTARAFDPNNNEIQGVIFTWTSSNTTVATVDQNGLATGLAPGTTEIRASARGVTSGPATLTVNDVQRVLTRIDVTPTSATIPVGGSQQFTARAFDQNNNEITGVTFTWASSDPNVATVDQNGLATGIAPGTTFITASSGNVTSNQATLTVVPATFVINEVLADPPGSAATDLVGDANHDGVRSASDDEFVEMVNSSAATLDISGWTIRTRATGGTTETIRHTFTSNTTVAAGTAVVVFGGGNFDTANPLFGCARVVKASTGGLSLTNSGLTITVRDAAGNLVTQFTYGGTTGLSGDNDQSLTRSPDITGSFVQHTTAAGAQGRRFSPGLRVDGTPFANCPGRLTSVTITPTSSSVAVGQTTQFTAQAFDQFGRPLTNVTITFASSDTNVATVDAVTTDPATGIATATVTGRNVGIAQITASATDGTTTVMSTPATLNVTAVPVSITRVEVAPASATINRGQTQQFTATAFDANNQPVPGVTFTWASSNTAVATVDQNGLATGVGIGTVNITASTSDGSGGTVSGQATLTVRVPLVINELLADPPGSAATDLVGDANRDGVRDSDDDEFVELLNNSNAPVDISGVVIADATSNRFTFPANTILAAGRAVIIFGGGTPPANDPAFGGALVFTTGTLSLNNTADTVTVKLPVSGTDVVISTHTYGAEANSDQSLTRSPDAEIGSTGGNFVQHTTATNSAGRVFSPGTRADGTPFGSPAITRIEVTPATATVNAGGTQLFTARAFSNVGGPEVEVLNVSFIWDSSDPTKATVSPTTGMTTTATGVAAGTSTIRARAGGQQGTATLTINALPTLSINDVSMNEGDAGTTTFTFTVSLSAPAPAGGVTFDISTQDGTATTADNDYVARSLTAQTIPAGQQTYTFDVTVNGDTKVEANETFSVNVTNVSGVTVSDGQGIGTIQNDDVSTLPALSINDVAMSEGNAGTTTFTFTVSLSSPAQAGGVTFDIATQDGTATAGSDYVARSLTAQTIPAGQQTYTFDVTVNGDTLVEPDETFLVNVTNVTGATVLDGQGMGTIQNDDTANVVISQVYGGGGNTSAPFTNDFIEIFNRGTTTVNLSGWSVQYQAATGTSTWSVTALSGTLQPGQYYLIQESGGAVGSPLPTPDATGTIAMAAGAGKVALLNTTTALTGACPSSANILDLVGYGTTANCFEGSGPAPAPSATLADLRANNGCTDTNNNAADFSTGAPNPRNTSSPLNNCSAPPAPTLSINDVTMLEGNSGTTTFTFTVSLSAAAPAGGVTFNIATQDGTATVANNDYVARSLTGQTITAGNQTYTFDVTVNGDTLVEPDETFLVNVTNVTGATVLDGQGQGTIQNDDAAALPNLSINDVTANEGNSGTTTFTFTVSLSAPAPAGGVTFNISTQDNTATVADNDYVARSLTAQTIPAGQQTYTFDVTVNGDTNVEPNETFFVNVTSVTGANVTDGQGTGTITNDDVAATPFVVISQVYGGGGNASAPFTNDFIEIFNRGTTAVNLAGWSVQYQTANGTSTWQVTAICPTGTCLLQPGQYFLVQEGGGATGSPLPTPNATGTIAMAATAGKVALLNTTTALTGACPSSANILDLVGYGTTANCFEGSGPAPAPSNTTADLRAGNGCTDTNSNAADFATGTPNPRNTSSPTNSCGGPIPPPQDYSRLVLFSWPLF